MAPNGSRVPNGGPIGSHDGGNLSKMYVAYQYIS